MYEGRGLQGLGRSLLRKPPSRQLSQLGVNQWNQFLCGLKVARGRGIEDSRHVVIGDFHVNRLFEGVR